MHYILNKRADTHPDFCEDAYFYTERDGWVIAAVFDGCSSGIQSHSASQLHSYALRKIVDLQFGNLLQMFNGSNLTTSEMLNSLCSLVSLQVNLNVDFIRLSQLENLSTMVIALYNPRRNYLMVKFMGDGAVSVNGVIHREDSGEANAPSYIGYLEEEECTPEHFSTYYPEFVYTNVAHWSIMTDGIDQIKHPHRPLEECIHYLLEDKTLLPSEAMLKRKLNILYKEDMTLNDDLTIIRYVNETV